MRKLTKSSAMINIILGLCDLAFVSFIQQKAITTTTTIEALHNNIFLFRAAVITPLIRSENFKYVIIQRK